MSFLKEEKRNRVLRWIKTLFFLITMVISLLMFSAPILVGIADAVLPSALLSASWSPASLYSNLSSYDFRYSLVDIPLISIVRSAIILCKFQLPGSFSRHHIISDIKVSFPFLVPNFYVILLLIVRCVQFVRRPESVQGAVPGNRDRVFGNVVSFRVAESVVRFRKQFEVELRRQWRSPSCSDRGDGAVCKLVGYGDCAHRGGV